MPSKINPVIPEAVTQGAIQVMGNDTVITIAASSGNMELNPFLPLIAHNLLSSIDLLIKSVAVLSRQCIVSLKVNEERIRSNINGSTAVATALISKFGYDKVSEIVKQSVKHGVSLKEFIVQNGYITKKELEKLISPQAVCRLGNPDLQKED
jgi:aspartate ammonia-lyase